MLPVKFYVHSQKKSGKLCVKKKKGIKHGEQAYC